MAGITKMVDDQIKTIRKERAELDAIKDDLDKREATLREQESAWETGDLSYLHEKNEALQKEIEDSKAELLRLREERNQSLTSFGSEIDQIHSERASETQVLLNDLKREVDSLNATKSETEAAIDRLMDELADMQRQKQQEQERMQHEKEQFLSRHRADRDDSLKELNLEHSMEVTALEQKRKEAEADIAALEQKKKLEWEQVKAEISRYKAAQKAEIDTMREQILAEAESERAEILQSAKKSRNERSAEFTELEKMREREINDLELKKQAVIDEIELLQYEYEKNKAENVVRFEKNRSEEQRILEDMRSETLARIEKEKKQELEDIAERKASLLSRIQDERAAHQQEVNNLEIRKNILVNDINQLNIKFDAKKADNEANIEILKSERLKEINEMRVTALQDIEEMRNVRMADLERVYFSRIDSLESARNEKLEESRVAAERVNAEIEALKSERVGIVHEIDQLRAETERLKEENEELIDRLNDEVRLAQDELRAQNSREIEALKAKSERIRAENATELQRVRSEKLREIEESRLRAQEELEQMRQDRLSELERSYASKVETLEAAHEEQHENYRAAITAVLSELDQHKQERDGIITQIRQLKDEYDQLKLTSKQELEEYRNDRIHEAEEAKLQKLREVEEIRQERAAELEKAYFEKMDILEAARNEKMDAIQLAINEAEQELIALKARHNQVHKEIDSLVTESNKLKAENESQTNRATIERQAELERLSAEKIREIEAICKQKLDYANEAEERIALETAERERVHKEQLATVIEEIKSLQQEQDNLESEISTKRNELLAEVETQKMEAMEEVSKLKLVKLKEVEQYLAGYKEEKLKQIQADTESRMETAVRSLEELNELNAECDRRVKELDELTMSLESEKRTIYLKEKLINEEQNDYKSLIQSEIEFHRREMGLLIEAKDQQINIMEDKIRTYIQEIEEYREDSTGAGAKTKKELITDVEYLRSQVSDLQKTIQSKPTDSYMIGLEERVKSYSNLEQENKRLAMRLAGLEQERHNWQIAVNEIGRLTEEKAVLEEQLARANP